MSPDHPFDCTRKIRSVRQARLGSSRGAQQAPLLFRALSQLTVSTPNAGYPNAHLLDYEFAPLK
jgi:hypothetical protein